jgi:hypothetical protein
MKSSTGDQIDLVIQECLEKLGEWGDASLIAVTYQDENNETMWTAKGHGNTFARNGLREMLVEGEDIDEIEAEVELEPEDDEDESYA